MEEEDNGQYVCSQCKKNMANKANLIRHMEVVHKVKRTGGKQCPYCDRVFSSSSYLERHIEKHENELPSCGVCGQEFQSKSELVRHSKEIHPEVTFDARKRLMIMPAGPSTKRQKTQIVYETNQEKPPLTGVDDVDAVVQRNWSSIKTRTRSSNVLTIVNVRTWNGSLMEESGDYDDNMTELLIEAWEKNDSRIKINCSVGCVLQNKSTEELRYFHSSSNNATLFDRPMLVSTKLDLDNFCQRYSRMDVSEVALRRRPNTAWMLRFVTNATFYMYGMHNMGKIGAPVDKNVKDLPDYIATNRHVVALTKNPWNNKPYRDKLCFFRCLALLETDIAKDHRKHSKRSVERETQHLYRQFAKAMGQAASSNTFHGVTCKDLMDIEEIFNVSITVLCLKEDGTSVVEWSTNLRREKQLYLNLYENHFSYITSIEGFAKGFSCPTCEGCYTRLGNMKRHKCVADKVTKLFFTGGQFTTPMTIFDKLRDKAGIEITESDLLYYEFRMTYDIECYLETENLPENTDTTEYTSRHQLLSISICTNIPKYKSPKCFIRKTTASECVKRFVDYALEAADHAASILMERFDSVFIQLRKAIHESEVKEAIFGNAHLSNPSRYAARKNLCNLEDDLTRYIKAVPMVGFNSGSYDLNVMKADLLRYLQEAEGEDLLFVVKKLNNLTSLETRRLRILDISNFVAPGYSYAGYLRAHGCTEEKGFFPYEWMDSLEKLKCTTLPPQKAFYSSLKKTNISDEDYAMCEEVWKKNNMKTFKDFVVWYNNLDVVPFLEAIATQSKIYRDKGIDMLKSAISLPGLSVRWLMTTLPTGYGKLPTRNMDSQPSPEEHVRLVMNALPVMLLGKYNGDIYQTLRDNMIGGPSIVFHRYHNAETTRLRSWDYGETGKLCKKVVGVDANALYLWALMQNQPVGHPFRRHEETGFKLERQHGTSKVAHGWLEYLALIENLDIQHAFNRGEKVLGRNAIPVDGFAESTQTVYQFHGCLWHGHQCLGDDDSPNLVRGMTNEELRQKTNTISDYLRSLGYNVISIWECEWERHVNSSPKVKEFLRIFFSRFYPKKGGMTLEQAIENIANGEYFGFVECDIAVPEHLREKFAEMPPIFKNTEVGRKDMSEHMRTFAEKTGYLDRPSRMLIGSLKGDKVTLHSELLRWYLEHGLIVSRIYQMMEYRASDCYRNFGESVSSARREGDTDPDKALLASTSKLVGNSAYGKTITRVETHKTVKYIEGNNKVSAKIRGKNFESLNQLDDNFFEVITSKAKINVNVPVTLGFTILQLAKLRMLQFYYDFMDKYVDRRDFQYMEMDTDSAYMAISAETLEECVRPEMRRDFYEHYGEWLPRPYCEKHAVSFVNCKVDGGVWSPSDCCLQTLKYDKRTPGLFKEEFNGNGMIALNSKTYLTWNDDNTKCSSKGLSHRTNTLTRKCFEDVLRSGISKTGENTGFVRKDNETFTYKQTKTGLSYGYAKRVVCADGVSTLPVDL